MYIFKVKCQGCRYLDFVNQVYQSDYFLSLFFNYNNFWKTKERRYFSKCFFLFCHDYFRTQMFTLWTSTKRVIWSKLFSSQVNAFCTGYFFQFLNGSVFAWNIFLKKSFRWNFNKQIKTVYIERITDSKKDLYFT